MIGKNVVLPRRGWRLQRRAEVTQRVQIVSRVVAVFLALLVAGIMFQLSGLSPLVVVQKALKSTLGSGYGLEQVALVATPLILTGLSVAVCMWMQLWNIGAEGQLFMGAWAATAVALYIDGPLPIMLVAMFLAGMAGGALWMLIPALARAYLNVNEIITTLLLNFVAVLLVNYFAIGPWRDRQVGVLSASIRLPYELPLIGHSSLHTGILIAILIGLGLAIAVRSTKWGFEVRIVGGNRRAAEFAGIRVIRKMITVMLLSGAIAGVAGVIEVAGTAHRLSGTISTGFGFLGIIVASLANASPLGVLIVGPLLAILLNAGVVLQTQGVSFNTMLAINGLILLFAAIGEVASKYKLVKPQEVMTVDDIPADEDANFSGRIEV